jgi:hypothetical protein
MENDPNKNQGNSLIATVLTFGSTLIAVISWLTGSHPLPMWAVVIVSSFLIFAIIVLLFKPSKYLYSKWTAQRKALKLAEKYYPRIKDCLMKMKREIDFQRGDNVVGPVFELGRNGFRLFDIGETNRISSLTELTLERLKISNFRDLENLTKTTENLVFQYNTLCLSIQNNLEGLRIEATKDSKHQVRSHWQAFWQKWEIGVRNQRDFIRKWDDLAQEINSNLEQKLNLIGFESLPLGIDIPPLPHWS